jgi:ribosomal protein S18 acetylase RimI-like enzyme
MNIKLERVTEKDEFLKMAVAHFRELSPRFVPASDWNESYFESIEQNPDLQLQWIIAEGERCGFVLYGFEPHRFLPRRSGMVYELYVAPQHRRRGIAAACGKLVIDELKSGQPSKIQLEVVEGNQAAALLWHRLGFKKVSERLVLK